MATILFFGKLPDRLGSGMETVELPANVDTVRKLLGYLGDIQQGWEKYLVEERVQVTVNKQFAEMDDAVSNADEIAVVSRGL